MENDNSTKYKILGYSLTAAVVVGTVYGLSKIYDKYQKDKAENQVEDKPEVRQATTIYSAMNPSGMDWMKSMDTTNTKMIFDTATEITNLNKVQDAYRKLYKSSLLDDLRRELSPEDYTKFLNTLKFSPQNINKAANKPKIDFKAGTYLATKLPTNIRKTPKNISKWEFDSNIIKLVEANKLIGYATGKTEFDNSGTSETGTLFIEIQSIALDTKRTLHFWAAASQLQTVTKAEHSAKKYPLFWLNEKEALSGFDGTQKRVIAFMSVPVLNEQFKVIGIASPLQQLGYSIMELNDNKGNEYVKFITNQKKQHWVNKKFIQLV